MKFNFRIIISVLLLPILILVDVYVVACFNRRKKEMYDFETNESSNEQDIQMKEEMVRKWKEEWWRKHYIVRFLYNLPPRKILDSCER